MFFSVLLLLSSPLPPSNVILEKNHIKLISVGILIKMFMTGIKDSEQHVCQGHDKKIPAYECWSKHAYPPIHSLTHTHIKRHILFSWIPFSPVFPFFLSTHYMRSHKLKPKQVHR